MNVYGHGVLVAVSRLVLCLALFSLTEIKAADVTLPEGWQQMAPAEFTAALRPIIFEQDAFDKLSYEEQTGVKERGKELFLLVDPTALVLMRHEQSKGCAIIGSEHEMAIVI